MFRMPPGAFKTLHDSIRPILRSSWTPKSKKMAELSSGSCVETIVLLAGTIRWLAGGSLWDIAFMFRMSYSTIHARKWDVIAAINKVLQRRATLTSPEMTHRLLCLQVASPQSTKEWVPQFQVHPLHPPCDSMQPTNPTLGVVAAVDSVCVQRKAPTARKNDQGTFTSSIAQAFNCKGYFATTVLAFVDSDLRFLSVSMSCYSSSHDSTLFSCSSTGNYIASGQLDQQWLIVGCHAAMMLSYVRETSLHPMSNTVYQ